MTGTADAAPLTPEELEPLFAPLAGRHLLVGWSGGPDSTALAGCLAHWAKAHHATVATATRTGSNKAFALTEFGFTFETETATRRFCKIVSEVSNGTIYEVMGFATLCEEVQHARVFNFFQ